ncbi:MAG TPA: ATP synthase F1 subunit gamma [Thermoanaerobaculia bacterium]|nr:ATP synthase F1 subunit gamma [Thermoanaerobaculia bacterium]
MANTIDIRRRIRSVKNTQQITRAMKMVAAAKLRRAHDRIVAARPYSAALREVLVSVATRVESVEHPLLREREEKRVLFVIVTADKGLCGAFNANVIKGATNTLRDRDWPEVQLIPIGRKGNDFFRRRQIPIRHQAVNIFQALALGHATDIAKTISDDFVSEKVDAVYVIYNEFRSVIQQTLRIERLLPLERLSEEQALEAVEYLYEPSPELILQELLPKHIEFQIYRILLESAAAEHGARMTAMESATKNASELIDSLTLTYNRIRQASITKEIIEIVSGAAAAK